MLVICLERHFRCILVWYEFLVNAVIVGVYMGTSLSTDCCIQN